MIIRLENIAQYVGQTGTISTILKPTDITYCCSFQSIRPT